MRNHINTSFFIKYYAEAAIILLSVFAIITSLNSNFLYICILAALFLSSLLFFKKHWQKILLLLLFLFCLTPVKLTYQTIERPNPYVINNSTEISFLFQLDDMDAYIKKYKNFNTHLYMDGKHLENLDVLIPDYEVSKKISPKYHLSQLTLDLSGVQYKKASSISIVLRKKDLAGEDPEIYAGLEHGGMDLYPHAVWMEFTVPGAPDKILYHARGQARMRSTSGITEK